MSRRRRRERTVDRDGRLSSLKYDVAQEIGLIGPGQRTGTSYRQALEDKKYEVAAELGLLDDVRTRGWGQMTARDCGRVGGLLGGRIGGQMVRRMIEAAKRNPG